MGTLILGGSLLIRLARDFGTSMHSIHYLALTLFISCSTLRIHAETFDFSFSSPGYDDNGNPITLSGAGELTTSLTGRGRYTIVSISGKTDGQTIAGLSSGYESDNELFFPRAEGGDLDNGGMTYALKGGGLVNLSFDGEFYQEYDYGDSLFAQGPLNITLVSPPALAPEPDSRALLSGALAVGLTLGLVCRNQGWLWWKDSSQENPGGCCKRVPYINHTRQMVDAFWFRRRPAPR